MFMLMSRAKTPTRHPAMDGAEDEMARQAAHGDRGGFRITDLADHDDLGVLAHERAQGDGIGEVLRVVDLGLGDHGEAELDRVLHRGNANGGARALDQM